jgi:hypothetical protein
MAKVACVFFVCVYARVFCACRFTVVAFASGGRTVTVDAPGTSHTIQGVVRTSGLLLTRFTTSTSLQLTDTSAAWARLHLVNVAATGSPAQWQITAGVGDWA